MKKIHYIGIFIILLILVGLFIVSPFSPLNKATIDGHTVKLSDGYTVQKTTETSLYVSNGTNDIYIFALKSNSVDEAINDYHNKYDNNYNITQTEIDSNGETIIKTVAKEYNSTLTINKYWFTKNDKIYDIQTNNPESDTEDIIKSMISSI